MTAYLNGSENGRFPPQNILSIWYDFDAVHRGRSRDNTKSLLGSNKKLLDIRDYTRNEISD